VDLLKRSHAASHSRQRETFLEEVRELLKRADESVEKVRAWLAASNGELRVGYAPLPRWSYCLRHSQRFKKLSRA